MRGSTTIVRVLAVLAMVPAVDPEPTPWPWPPRQGAPWTPPGSKLPPSLVSAATTLFEQGLADPRGCAYREIRLESDRGWPTDPKAGRPALRGWVLPETSGQRSRFAVGWDGLVHPLAEVGPEADLVTDVRAMTKVPEPAAGRPGPRWADFGHGGNWDDRTHAANNLMPMKAVLLLRLGRADLAEQVWAAGTGLDAVQPRRDQAEDGVSYLTLAGDWAWCLLDRTLVAHARGDDPLALAGARELARVRHLIEAQAEAMSLPRRQAVGGYINGQPINVRILPHLDFLDQVPLLLADQERRAKEPRREGDPTKVADRPARVAALIRAFDQMGIASYSSFGRANLGAGDVVQAVAKEGDAAVGPLLDCLEKDDRLTRTVHRDHRRATRYVRVQGVNEAAFSALTQVFSTCEFGPVSRHYSSSTDDHDTRRAAAAEVRAYWEKNRGAGPEERWYRTLADDSASPEQWLDAAEALSQPTNVHGRNGSYTTYPTPPGAVVPPRGEPLRGKKTPSIAELMARRVEAIGQPGAAGRTIVVRQDAKVLVTETVSGSSSALFTAVPANRMAFYLARWDLKAALPTLKDQFAFCARFLALANNGTTRQAGLEADMARMTLLRVEGGDASALDDYAAWLRSAHPKGYEVPPADMFEPLWRNPDHPAVAAAAVALFDDPKSPWVSYFHDRDQHPQWAWGQSSLAGLMTSPLLGVEPFRKLVLACLEDKGEAGSIATDAGGKITVATSAGTSSFEPAKDDPLRPKPSTTMVMRRADLWCQSLQNLGGMPRFEIFWPEAERDRAIAACAALLRQYGERFRFDAATRPRSEYDPFDRDRLTAVLAFPALDHPATAEDVRAGRAIFAIEGAAEARRWPLPARFLRARWTAMAIAPDDPSLARFRGNPLVSMAGQIEKLQGGTVWQAEEAREGDQWRRYYGFVGRHAAARVPAEEVEFPAPWDSGWRKASRAIDARIIPPGGRDDGARVFEGEVAAGAALPVEVQLRNRLGVDFPVQADWLRAGDPPTLREGVTIRLFRAPDDPPKPSRTPDASPPWDEVAARAMPRHRGDPATRTLAPAEAISALKFDLRDLFVIDRPGRYRLDVTLEDLKTAEGKPVATSAHFAITAATKAE